MSVREDTYRTPPCDLLADPVRFDREVAYITQCVLLERLCQSEQLNPALHLRLERSLSQTLRPVFQKPIYAA